MKRFTDSYEIILSLFIGVSTRIFTRSSAEDESLYIYAWWFDMSKGRGS